MTSEGWSCSSVIGHGNGVWVMLYILRSSNDDGICLCRRVFRVECLRIVVLVYWFFDVEIVMDGDWFVVWENVPMNVIVVG